MSLTIDGPSLEFELLRLKLETITVRQLTIDALKREIASIDFQLAHYKAMYERKTGKAWEPKQERKTEKSDQYAFLKDISKIALALERGHQTVDSPLDLYAKRTKRSTASSKLESTTDDPASRNTLDLYAKRIRRKPTHASGHTADAKGINPLDLWSQRMAKLHK